jgi:tetrahydromethanopterin S-methyltransferase subunit B
LLIDKIFDSKQKIAKYNKHFESLNAIEKIEIKEEIEKLENIINETIHKIDEMVYKLYGLSSEEIKIVEKN